MDSWREFLLGTRQQEPGSDAFVELCAGWREPTLEDLAGDADLLRFDRTTLLAHFRVVSRLVNHVLADVDDAGRQLALRWFTAQMRYALPDPTESSESVSASSSS